jgi:hypothetical protein
VIIDMVTVISFFYARKKGISVKNNADAIIVKFTYRLSERF